MNICNNVHAYWLFDMFSCQCDMFMKKMCSASSSSSSAFLFFFLINSIFIWWLILMLSGVRLCIDDWRRCCSAGTTGCHQDTPVVWLGQEVTERFIAFYWRGRCIFVRVSSHKFPLIRQYLAYLRPVPNHLYMKQGIGYTCQLLA